MGRYYSLDRTMVEAANDQERVRAGLIEGLGATSEQLVGARRVLHRTGHDRPPDQVALGPQAAGRIKGEAIIIEESHTNAHGDRVTVGYRQNGPHMERLRIREQRVGENTLAVTEHFGRR